MPIWLIKFLPYILGGLALVGATVWATSSVDAVFYGAQINQMKADHAQEIAKANSDALKKYQDWTKNQSEAVSEANSTIALLNSSMNNIQRELRNVKTKLPADCRPDADRMRALTAAYAAASNATTTGR